MNGTVVQNDSTMASMDIDRRISRPSIVSQSEQFSVGYAFNPIMMLHSAIHGHHEQPERISTIHRVLVEHGCSNQMKRIRCRQATRQEVLLVHSEDLWDKVQALGALTKQEIQQSESFYEQLSLYVSAGTPMATRLSCGGVIEAALAVARGEVKKAFANVRPPGHHSEPLEPMGFCFFNNVAVATRVLQLTTSFKRIMILDWDIHHGNGTQLAFNDDPSVLYVSIHRYEQGRFYPCGPFGALDSCGQGPGVGYSVNIPWPEKGMGDADYLHAFQKIVMPIGVEFAPDLVIISAGFDAADGDDLGECHVTPAGYAHMTYMLSSLAEGRLVVALEGGYNLESISKSALAVVQIMLGDPLPRLKPMIASEVATETIWQVAMEQSKYWKNLDPKACEPREHVPATTFSIPELLKAHRQDYMYREYDMMQIPLRAGLEANFAAQAMCTPNFMEADSIVVFLHEFGEICAELQPITCNVQLEYSYLVDISADIVSWIREKEYGLLDVNIIPRESATWMAKNDDLSKDLVTYLWDNYVLLSHAKRIVIIGQGSACQAVMDLLNSRTKTVMKYMTAVIQIVGHSRVPLVPKQSDELKWWYIEHSQVYVPTGHRFFRVMGAHKRQGTIILLENERSAKLIKSALPQIRIFVQQSLRDMSGISNGAR